MTSQLYFTDLWLRIYVVDAAFIFWGGAWGYYKAKSKASLIAGAVCGLTMTTTAMGAWIVRHAGNASLVPLMLILLVLSYTMAYMFYKKYMKSKNATPADETLLESGGQQKGNILFLCLTVMNAIVSIMGTPLVFVVAWS
mmetsp:Transcript_17509/g.23605  ORF Transcript_17509/g.23605 Transcript_17509/m.23605 type:complete len:140 (-) Transcript_17509:114-533(-)